MQDEMNITVIAAGFTGLDNPDAVPEAAPAEEKASAEQPQQQTTQKSSSAIGDYSALFQIFNDR
jgi:hypothetical protein